MLAAAKPPGLHPGFVYDVIPTSTAIVDRRQSVSAYPTSATSLSQNGTRSCRISIGSDGFCDASSIRLMFTINNLDTTKQLRPYSGPWGCWSRVRLMSQGTLLESLDHYGRHHEFFGFQLLPLQDQWSEAAVTGIHGSWGSGMDQLQPKLGRIEPNKRVTVLHKLNLSLFNSQKILPLRYCPLELDLTLAAAKDWVDTVTLSAGNPSFSSNYSISDIRVIYDMVLPDESLIAQFYSGLLNNQIMSIPVLCAYQFSHSIVDGATSVDITASRAFSKISSIWVSFSGNVDNLNADFRLPVFMDQGFGVNPNLDTGSPGWAPSIRMSIGGKSYPDPAPADTIAMQYYHLQKALGYSPNITRDDYMFDTYAYVFDTKRVPFDHGSGISSRSGDLIRIEVKNLDPAREAKLAHVTMFCYAVVAIREISVQLLD